MTQYLIIKIKNPSFIIKINNVINLTFALNIQGINVQEGALNIEKNAV